MNKLAALYAENPVLFVIKTLVAIIGVSISLFQLYTGAFGVFDAYLQRTIHILPLIALVFLTKPTYLKSGRWVATPVSTCRLRSRPSASAYTSC